MSKIGYAIKTGDKFIELYWNDASEWGEVVKVDDLSEYNAVGVLFNNCESAYDRMDKLIKDVNLFGSIDEIEIEDIDSMRVVVVEYVIEFK